MSSNPAQSLGDASNGDPAGTVSQGSSLPAGHCLTDDPAARLPGFARPLIVAIGLVAGLASFGIGEIAPSLVPPSFEFSQEVLADRNRLPAETQRRMTRSQDLAAAIAYGSLGILLGLGLGLAGGSTRGAEGRALPGALSGIVLGGVAGAGASLLILPLYHAARKASNDDDVNLDLALALVTHGGIWLAIGAAAGAALGLGQGGSYRIPRGVVGGILGAGLAAVIYEVVGALAFPLAQTFRPRATTWPARLMAHLLVAMLTSVLALWAIRNVRLGKAPTVAPGEVRAPAALPEAGVRS